MAPHRRRREKAREKLARLDLVFEGHHRASIARDFDRQEG